MLEKRLNETDLEYHKRIIYGKLVDKTLSDYDYTELSPYVYGKEYSGDVARRMFYGSKKTLEMLDDLRAREECMTHGDSLIDEMDQKRIELQKERKKLQTEKIEYNRMLLETARDEMIFEKLSEAISNLEPFDYSDVMFGGTASVVSPNKTGVLAFGDEHYGAKFEARGLNGEVINAYSVEIAENRMKDLLNQVINIVAKEELDTIHVFNMGDFTDGVLRVGQLKKLQLGVVDSTVRYMEFLSSWLNELSKYVRVRFSMVHGNHSELRMLGQQKGTFKDENMGKVVAAYIKMRLENNPNFEFIDNPTGLIFENILGYNVLGIHGEVKNLERALRDFSSMYGVDIDFILGGHLHHAETINAGYRKEAIRVPSVVGVDEFSMSLHKTCNAGATFFTIEEGKGKSVEYSIYLN